MGEYAGGVLTDPNGGGGAGGFETRPYMGPDRQNNAFGVLKEALK
jgi:hypothetical protein